MAKREVKTNYGQQQTKLALRKGRASAYGHLVSDVAKLASFGQAVTGQFFLAGITMRVAKSFEKASVDLAADGRLAAAKTFAAEHFARRARPSTSYAPVTDGAPGAPGAPGGALFNEVNRRAANPADKGVHLWDRVTNAMEMGQIHPKAEQFYWPFQTAMRNSLQTRGEVRQGRAYLNDAAARKAAKPTAAPIKLNGQRPAASPPASSNGMVKEYSRRDGTRVQGYRRSN